MSTLSIKNLKVSVEDKEIVRGVDFEVKTGEVRVLMGPNGSGKSTLSYALAGHPRYKILKGSRIILDGRDITKWPCDERARAGIFLSFQNPVSIPGVGVSSILRMRVNKDDFSTYYKKLLDASSSLKIGEEFLRRPLNEDFSGGEKKRMELLQAMMLEPKFVIFDEIDTGLDVDMLRLVGEKIAEFKKECGVILITHYQRILKYVTPDYVSVLKDGRVVSSGGSELLEKIERKGYAAVN